MDRLPPKVWWPDPLWFGPGCVGLIALMLEGRTIRRGAAEQIILGLNRSAIGTLVERTTRFTMLLHLPPMQGHGQQPRTKNGPPLAGHGAEAVREEIAHVIATLPISCDAHSRWTNEALDDEKMSARTGSWATRPVNG